jgi:20S proteasome alpha/beta subunit
LQRPRLGIIAPSIPTIGATSTNIRRYVSSNDNNPVKVHPSIQGLVKVLATRDDVDRAAVDATSQNNNNEDGDDVPIHTLHTAIVSTGIQSDATFLLNQLQRHFSKFWFRYNTLPMSTLAVVKHIREVLLDCMGYDWSMEVSSAKVSGGVGSAAPSYNENEDDDGAAAAAAGRPLGVSSFLLSFANDDIITSSSSSSYPPRPTITLIEANGSPEQYVARAMGVGAKRANELLSQKWKRGMSREEVKDMMQEILAEVAIERGWMFSDDDNDDGDDESISGSNSGVECDNAMHVGLTIACETLTTRGIDIEFSPLPRLKKL